MNLCQTQTMSCNLVGGMTSSVFPQAESLLLGETDHWEALKFVAQRKNMDRYQSVMDFLFCETFTDYRGACQRFYEERGNPLERISTVEQRDKWDHVLVQVLEVALHQLQQDRYRSWCWVTSQAKREAA